VKWSSAFSMSIFLSVNVGVYNTTCVTDVLRLIKIKIDIVFIHIIKNVSKWLCFVGIFHDKIELILRRKRQL
jgi:hypothetical protein